MLKKMIVSIIIMSIIVFSALLIFISGTTLGQPSEEKSLSYSFDNEKYPFYITDPLIEEEINKGIESLHTIDDYILPEKSNSLKETSDVLFSYIEPPALSAANMARSIYHQFGRKVRTSEVKGSLMDSYLPFVVRFNENKGYIYEVYFVQNDEKITPYLQEDNNKGGLVTVYFPVENINFNQPGDLHIVDSVESTNKVIYHVDFSLYYRNN